MKILVVSDTHIKDRASEVPNLMVELINAEGPYDIVVFAGDLVDEEALKWVKSLASKSYVVCGNMDYLDLPEYEVFGLGSVRIGVTHGHQVYPRGDIHKLYRLAKTLDVDLLVSGHTHKLLTRVYQGKLLVNPGSLTGAMSGGGSGGIPSFIVIKVFSNIISLHTYAQAHLGSADYLKSSYRFVVEGGGVRAYGGSLISP